MYAIVETGGKQYKLAEGDVVKVELIKGEVGEQVNLDRVLLVKSSEDNIQVGSPVVAGATVAVKILEHGRHKKILVMKYKKRKDYRRKNGHRQCYTQIRVEKISAPGVSISK